MPDYPTIDPRAFGRTYSVSRVISRLPVDLLRTALVTRQPQATAQAIADYREYVAAPQFEAPRNLPQRMMFQQHKTGPSGVSRGNPRDPLSSATSATQALSPTQVVGRMAGMSAVSVLSLRVPEHVPTYKQAQAANARGAQVMTVPEVAPVPEQLLRTRPLRQRIAPPLQAYGDDLAEAQQRAAAEASFRAGNAMQGVALAQANVRRILGR